MGTVYFTVPQLIADMMTSRSILAIEFGQASVAGVKPCNEDSCGVRIPDEPLLTSKGVAAVVADGMSASDAGREASEACVSGFMSDYFSTPESWTTRTSSHKVLSALNQWLHAQGQKYYGSAKGMVTTLSVLILKSNTAYIFHIGDTRIYRLRDGQLELLTTDHRIHAENKKAYLTRALGIDLSLDIDYRVLDLCVGDVFVMLTDGVYEFLNDEAVRQILLQQQDLNAASSQMIESALQNHSDDNLTCQVLRVNELPAKNEDEFYRELTALPFPPPLEAGMILDGYKIVRQLHSSRRTEVYLARDVETNRQIVLKAPSINYTDDAAYINQFLHEEWAGRRINNQHVLKVLEQKQQRQALYYVVEYIEGQSLRQWMTDHPQPPLVQVRNIIEQIAHGLRAFHRLEMIHQDLKPENILIDEEGTVKLIDFGSTKIAGIEEIANPLNTSNLLGTVNYTAPEYHWGNRGSNRSDIFSLGVITYEMLTGRLPYDKEMSKRNLGRLHYIPVRDSNRDVPIWIDRAIEKAVRINPDNRFSRLSEFTYALSHSNSTLIKQDFIPLLERNPAQVWRVISLIQFFLIILLIYLLAR